MKSSFCLSLQKSYRPFLDLFLHQRSTSFQNEKRAMQTLFPACKQYHSTCYLHPRKSSSTIYVHTKCHQNLNTALLKSTLKIRNSTVISKRCYNSTRSNNDNSNKDLAKSSKYPGSNAVISDRYIYVKTLDSLYEDVLNGIVLDTAYGDSRPDDDFNPSVPVVLALHDTPGSHKDVVPLLSFFAKLGCRTVCPTFPGHGETRGIMRNFDDIFSQATMERATFVHDFLGDLGIERVDVVIGVGASSYTAMALCLQKTDVYKSMALISPWPHTQPRFEVNSKMMERIHELWEMVYFRPLARLFLPALKVGNAVTSDEKITACYLIKNLDFGEADGFALTAAMTNVPRLVAYGGKDDLVSEALYEDVLSKLGIDSDQVISDHQRGPSKDIENHPRALRFPDSGYDILNQHRAVLCAHILQLLRQFHPSIKI